MDSTKQLILPKTENPYDLNWFYFEDPFEQLLELPPLHSLLDYNDFNYPLAFSDQNNYINLKCFEDTTDRDYLWFDDYNVSTGNHYSLTDVMVEAKPLNMVMGNLNQCDNFTSGFSQVSNFDMNLIRELGRTSNGKEEEIKKSNRKKKSAFLELEEIQKHYDMPISKAAKEMKVGLTVLKKRCRELNIKRWPHRKIKSLKSLIGNVKELGCMTNEIVMLEEHKRLLEKVPDMELTEKTKKLRQACFKANYKKRRFMAAVHS